MTTPNKFFGQDVHNALGATVADRGNRLEWWRKLGNIHRDRLLSMGIVSKPGCLSRSTRNRATPRRRSTEAVTIARGGGRAESAIRQLPQLRTATGGGLPATRVP